MKTSVSFRSLKRYWSACAFLVISVTAAGCRSDADGSAGQVNRKSTRDAAEELSASNRVAAKVRSLNFITSLHDGLALARQDGRRVLVYFTGKSCAWCRKMEQDTFTDSQVLHLAQEFVCVKVSIDEKPELQEQYRVYSIPRTFIVTTNEAPVAQRIGYLPPDEYTDFLTAAKKQSPTTWESLFDEMLAAKATERGAQPLKYAPPAVGAEFDEADLLIWFVDRHSDTFADPRWAAHTDLLRILDRHGVRPRVEHVPRWDLMERWNNAGRGAPLLIC